MSTPAKLKLKLRSSSSSSSSFSSSPAHGSLSVSLSLCLPATLLLPLPLRRRLDLLLCQVVTFLINSYPTVFTSRFRFHKHTSTLHTSPSLSSFYCISVDWLLLSLSLLVWRRWCRCLCRCRRAAHLGTHCCSTLLRLLKWLLLFHCQSAAAAASADAADVEASSLGHVNKSTSSPSVQCQPVSQYFLPFAILFKLFAVFLSFSFCAIPASGVCLHFTFFHQPFFAAVAAVLMLLLQLLSMFQVQLKCSSRVSALNYYRMLVGCMVHPDTFLVANWQTTIWSKRGRQATGDNGLCPPWLVSPSLSVCVLHVAPLLLLLPLLQLSVSAGKRCDRSVRLPLCRL